MKRVFLIGLIVCTGFFSRAQQDVKAKEILDEVSNKTSSYKSIVADFVFTMQNKEMEIDERNEGTIKLKGQKYVVVLPDVGITVFSDGITIWNYMKDGNQVTISNVDEAGSELMDPSSLFTIYEKGFKSKFVNETVKDNKTVYQIDLFPEDESQDVSKVSLFIDKKMMLIHSAVLYGTDGNLYGVEVKKMDTDQNLPDSGFVFSPENYKDVEIIDFR